MLSSGPWPHGAHAAIALTFDNMGEAAELNRNLWPATTPIGNHISITEMIPQFLALVRRYAIPITYFAEAWNLAVYPRTIRRIAEEGHEVAWHAWQHEAWGRECADAGDERRNFERSFGVEEGMAGFLARGGEGEGSKVRMYRGFRPPGGVIHGERTLRTCREFGLGYISPAAEEGALVPLGDGQDAIVVLPFRWRTVDAYYYTPHFASLRKQKGEYPEEPQSPLTLAKSYIAQIDEAIEKGGFVSFLFHPYITGAEEERMQAMETVLKHLVQKREEGKIWLARCGEVEEFVRDNPGVVGKDPGWDNTSWM